jgi:hypothetical protein
LKYGGAKPIDQALMNGLPEAVETDHGLTCQSLKTLVFRKYRLSVEMLYQEKSSKIQEFRKYSCTGILVKFGEMLWLGTARTNDQVQQRSGYR